MATLQEQDPNLIKEKRKGYSLAGSLSLFIHLGILMLIGGTVIVESVIPKQPMTGEVVVSAPAPVDSDPTEPEQTPDELPPAADVSQATPSAAADSSPFDLNTIQVDAPTPSFNISVSANPGKTFGEAPKALNGSEAGGRATGAPKKINIFGAQTETKKLGVILDCSGSAHAYLLAAMKEIDKNFEDAPTVLAVGCGMADKKDVKVEVYGRIKADKEKDKSGSRTILGQLAMAEAKYKDLEKYLNRMKKRNEVFAINGGDISAVHFGFNHLIKEGVDTIYWFADFQDKLDPGIFDKLTAELKRKDIKVIAHNFSGKPVPAQATKMATDTGGQTIAKIPK